MAGRNGPGKDKEGGGVPARKRRKAHGGAGSGVRRRQAVPGTAGQGIEDGEEPGDEREGRRFTAGPDPGGKETFEGRKIIGRKERSSIGKAQGGAGCRPHGRPRSIGEPIDDGPGRPVERESGKVGKNGNRHGSGQDDRWEATPQ